MPAPTLTYNLYDRGPGWLYWAPIASTLPTNTVAGGIFTDAWTSPWIFLGPTDSGSDWSYNMASSPVEVAESLDPVRHQVTSRSGSAQFALANYTATNLAAALNGAAKTVTGAAATTLTKITPVAPGQEVRFMLGWESADFTVRKIAYQCLNTGDIKESMNKQAAHTSIPWNAMFEVPASGVPYETWFAGVNRG